MISRRDSGASSVEYALIAASIAAVIAVTVYLFGGTVLGLFTEGCQELGLAVPDGECSND